MCGALVCRIRSEQSGYFLKKGGVITPPFCFDGFVTA
jgi:hypothetical protein